jgi:hypothetical protein
MNAGYGSWLFGLSLGAGRDSRLADRRKLLARNGRGAETFRREHLGRHLPARRHQLCKSRHDKHAAWRGHWVLVR